MEDNYGMDQDSYKQCQECEGDKNIVNNACENASLMTCPKCSGEGEILMEFEEYKMKWKEELEDQINDRREEQKYENKFC